MKKHIPNVFTILNLISGFLGITFFISDFTDYLPYCIYISLTFDYLDGFAARKFNLVSDFGKHLDSLVDLISFGVLPSLLVFDWFYNYSSVQFLEYISIIIIISSAIRLAKFNTYSAKSFDFIGLPTPANALFFVSIFYSTSYMSFFLNEVNLMILVIIFSLLMISNIRFYSLKFINYTFNDNKNKYIIIFGSFLGLFLLGIDGFPFIILYYIVYSIFNYVFLKLNSK